MWGIAEFAAIVGRAFLPAAGFQPAGPPERRLQPGLAATQQPANASKQAVLWISILTFPQFA
jgi:hypothetical protein